MINAALRPRPDRFVGRGGAFRLPLRSPDRARAPFAAALPRAPTPSRPARQPDSSTAAPKGAEASLACASTVLNATRSESISWSTSGDAVSRAGLESATISTGTKISEACGALTSNAGISAIAGGGAVSDFNATRSPGDGGFSRH